MDFQAKFDKVKKVVQGREPFLSLSRWHWLGILIFAFLTADGLIETVFYGALFYALVLGIVTIERREKSNLPLKYLQLKQKGTERQLFIAAFLKEIYADSEQADQAYALIFDQKGVNEAVLKKNIALMADIQHYFSSNWIPPSLKQVEQELDLELDEIERKWERFVETYGDRMDERDINFLRRWIKETRKEEDEDIYQ